jgi:hypothetical protein
MKERMAIAGLVPELLSLARHIRAGFGLKAAGDILKVSSCSMVQH